MHEAQNPEDGANIQNLNSVDFPQSSEGTTNPFYSILVGEHKARELLLLAAASEENQSNQIVGSSQEEENTENIDTEEEKNIIDSTKNQSTQFDEEINLENPLQDDWVAEPNFRQQAIVNTEFEKLLALNEELRSANTNLYKQAEELTNALSDSEAALQRQHKRSTVAESMLKQQTQELSAAQAQIQSLFEQLENSMQNVQRQTGLADSYRTHLELNQQRLAQLERECAVIQNKYSEQTRLLSQSENTCRELRTRLKRQQRQTLQFKAALEKSLETSIPGYDTPDENDSNLSDTTTSSQLDNQSAPKSAINSMQSIQPWSAPSDSISKHNSLWGDILTTSATNEGENEIQEEFSTWEFTANSDLAPVEDSDSDDNHSTAEPTVQNQELPTSDSASQETTVNQATPGSDSSELEEQLDTVIQTFFASQTESVSSQSSQEQDSETHEDIVPTWKTTIESHDTDDNDDEPIVSFTSSMNDALADETRDYWEEVSHFPAFDLSGNPASLEISSEAENETSSPSPLIYPKRPPKGRKSLASVELPKFPQKDENKDKNDGDNS